MNIHQRIAQLESHSPERGLTKAERAYAVKMIVASGCNKTIEQLDNGENLNAFEIVLKAYGSTGNSIDMSDYSHTKAV